MMNSLVRKGQNRDYFYLNHHCNEGQDDEKTLVVLTVTQASEVYHYEVDDSVDHVLASKRLSTPVAF